jgi:hypothetical protein
MLEPLGGLTRKVACTPSPKDWKIYISNDLDFYPEIPFATKTEPKL